MTCWIWSPCLKANAASTKIIHISTNHCDFHAFLMLVGPINNARNLCRMGKRVDAITSSDKHDSLGCRFECVIHLGAIASEDAITSFKTSLSKHGGMIHVTSGVHDELKTVRFRSWRERPRV